MLSNIHSGDKIQAGLVLRILKNVMQLEHKIPV